jgi:hypothetical protein
LIRIATMTDIPAMVEVVREASDRSIDGGRLTFDPLAVKRLLASMVQQRARHWVGVSVVDDKVEGLLAGLLQPFYQCAVELEATDLFWLVTPRGSKRDWVQLMLAFVDWAKAHPKVARISCGVTRIVDQDEKAGRVLEGAGFAQFGHIYRMEVAA